MGASAMSHELSITVERDGKHFIESSVEPGKVLEGPFATSDEVNRRARQRSDEFVPGQDLPEGFTIDPEELPEGFTIDEPSPAFQFTKAGFQGFNVGLADIAGLPGDLTRAGINALLNSPMEAGQRGKGGPTIGSALGIENFTPDQIGGSQQARRLGAALGFNYTDISEVPERFRPVARAGEAIGGSVPFAAVPFAAAARLGTKPAQGVFRAFVEPARTMPGRTALVEAAAAGGAGVGAGVAETLDPGDPLTRMGGELAGGIFSPFAVFSRITRRLTGGLTNTARRVRESFSPAAAKKGAARHAQEIIGIFPGEDIPTIAARLRERPAVEAPISAGAKSQSLGIQALERKLVNDSAIFGIDMQRDLKTAIDNINFAFNEVAGTGNPEALRDLALARKEYARTLIDTRINTAERRVIEARESVVPSASTNVEVNRRAKNILREALDDARAVETEIWGEIPKDIPVAPENLRQVHQTEVSAGLLPGETVDLPGPVQREIKRLTAKRPKGKPPTSGELLRLRSRILVETRKEAGSQAPDRDRIRRLGLLADSILDDLGSIPGTEEARAFSRDLNDRFTRGYGGKVLSLDPRGGEKIPAELTLERGVGAAGPGGAVAAENIETAVTPFGRMAENARVREMRELEGEIIRDMAASSINPATGQIDPRALERFRTRNNEILARFPELDRTLADAGAVTSIYGRRIKRLMDTDKNLQTKSAFARVLAAEDPTRVMKAALAGPNPTADMDQIFLLARKDSKALEGARRSYLDLLFNASAVKLNLPGGETTLISGARLRGVLNAGDGGVLRAAKKSGVLNNGEVKRLNTIADEADKIESAMKFPGQLDKVVKDPSMLTDLLARVVGANIGSHSIFAKTSGAQLVMAQAGSRFVRNLIDKLPAQNITKVLRAAVRDPDLMAALLTKPVGETQAKRIINQITKKLSDQGILYRISETWSSPVGFIGSSTRNLVKEQDE